VPHRKLRRVVFNLVLPIDHPIVVATFCEDGMVAFLRAVVVSLVLDFVDGGMGLVS
jgi:hypothetical protein